MATATPAQHKTRPSRKRGIAFFLLMVALLALGAWFWNDSRRGTSSGAGHVKTSLHLETFVLNLADREQRSYLRVGIDLGLGREIGKGENAPPLGQVRDTILGVLALSKVDELMTAPGKAKLKQDLLRVLQERVPELEVQEVYFTEFLIQR